MIVVSKFFVPKKHKAITIWPFVILRSSDLKNDKKLINHERIHIRQQIELLIIPFYIWYGIEFLVHLAKGIGWNKAYKSISFEKEAYQHDGDLNYLKNRSFWKFFSFFGRKS